MPYERSSDISAFFMSGLPIWKIHVCNLKTYSIYASAVYGGTFVTGTHLINKLLDKIADSYLYWLKTYTCEIENVNLSVEQQDRILTILSNDTGIKQR